MCGLAGVLTEAGGGDAELRGAVSDMAATLVHRGPDDAGVWVDAAAGVGLGFRRLAILDLSEQGHQPMVSANERFVIVFNGEIYNHLDLRKELECKGHRFRGTSDTEVILEAADQWGLDRLVERLWGMFAIALWDCRDRVLLMCRDRLGKKPLYYGYAGRCLLFASELKALRAFPTFRAELNVDALAAYLRYAYVPTPACIYSGVSKLPAGSFALVRPGESPRIQRYWQPETFLGDVHRVETGSDQEVIEQTEALLMDAVQRRMIADVPLGALLSGGVDSSVVAAMMRRLSTSSVRTFSIGFLENAYNEAHAARAVAKYLATDHEELYVSASQAQALIPSLPEIYDEPFADSSQIPTTLLSRLTRRQVTVGLSGDGGDELFGGYTRYSAVASAWASLERLPAWVRRGGAWGIRALEPQTWDRVLGTFAFAPPSARVRLPGQKLHKLAAALDASDGEAFYRRVISVWQRPSDVLNPDLRGCESGLGAASVTCNQFSELRDYMMAADLLTYLRDDILAKVDRASMSASLEVRGPLLDHRLVEWAFRLPSRFKWRGGRGKWLLRQVLARHVPPALTDRPKAGFDVPIANWLRGPLRPWAEDLLSESELESSGLLAPAVVRRVWAEHLRGHGNHEQRLWTVIMFQSWRRRWRM